METMAFRCRGESYKVLISEIHKSILLLVREQDILTSPQLTYAGLSQRVQPKDVMALCGIYVDDYSILVSRPTRHCHLIPGAFEKYMEDD